MHEPVRFGDKLASSDEIFAPKISDLFVVPRGVKHCPRADDEAHILLIEPEGTPNVGDADAEAAPEVEI